MTVLTAQPTIYMTRNEVRIIACSFKDKLTIDDLLTGTPTITDAASGPASSSPAVNALHLDMEIPGNQHRVKAGQAVTFKATASNTTAGTYTYTVSCGTVNGQTLQAFVIIVVSAS